MRFLMLVATDPEAEPYAPEEDDVENWFEEVSTSGAHLDGNRLRPAEEAKTVRVRAGHVQVTDGPFAETKEVMVGYDLLECTDLEEAVAIASRHPMARFGRIEVRAIWPLG